MNSIRLNIIRSDYGTEMSKERNFSRIQKFYNLGKKNEYVIDDQTWNDLDMDKVYEKLDRTYSSPGEAALYSMLRNPLSSEEILKSRGNLIDIFKNNRKLREKLSCIFYALYRDRKNNFLDIIENKPIINKPKYFLYTLLGKLCPIIFLFLTLFVNFQFILILFALSFINISINFYERNTVKSNGIIYLRKIILTAKRIKKINDPAVNFYSNKIESILAQIKNIDSGTKFVGLTNMLGGFFEPIAVPLLLEESAYYYISDKLNKEKDYLMDLYYTIGELDALISMANYQHGLDGYYVKPRFTNDIVLNISQGIHPILKKSVANSIDIHNQGIVLTGTNMSGKSTFLRMLGINIILAQTFYFAIAKDYEAPFFNIVSSISPNDDVTQGKSYFMAEVEALLRIIKATEKERPVFCAIDEIFRGTNPIERIAMSAEILTYLNNGRTITIASTHDRDLVDILKDNYDFYYFSENVDSNTGLSFDYKLKKGTSQTKNAIKLLEYMNYPKEITEKAFKRAEKIEGFL